MKYFKRLSLLILTGFMILSMSGCSTTSNEEEQKNFDAFINKEFVETMESDYSTMHTFLEHPENYGVDASKVTVNLGERMDIETIHKNAEKEAEAWKEFNKFTREKLTDDQKDTYDTYKYQHGLDEKLNDAKFDYYDQPFASISGIHYQLPITFSDWELRNEQDVKDIILLMKDVSPYIESFIAYTKQQADQGLTMIDLDAVKEYCEGIVKSGEKSAVLTSLNETIDGLKLDTKKGESYKKELKEAFFSSFLPAYEKIIDLMNDLKKSDNNEEGLAKFKYGKEYYTLLLQQNIGSNKSVDEVKTMIANSFEKHIMNMMNITQSNEKITKAFNSGKLPTTKYKSYDEILAGISAELSNDFPAVKDLKYNIKNVNKEIASSTGVAAYFNLPPLDGTGEKRLRVNPSTGNVNEIETFSTVAHEGFPGHMFQIAYMYENKSSPYDKVLANSLAYTEGYAVYAELYAYRYLDDIDEDILEVMKENKLANYDLTIIADIGIHYEGWSMKDYKAYFESIGYPMQDEDAKASYKQLQANPSAFQPYYVGYEEIDALKEKAKKDLGDKFEDKGFHEALLKSGNAPFSVVEKNIKAYIKNKK